MPSPEHVSHAAYEDISPCNVETDCLPRTLRLLALLVAPTRPGRPRDRAIMRRLNRAAEVLEGAGLTQMEWNTTLGRALSKTRRTEMMNSLRGGGRKGIKKDATRQKDNLSPEDRRHYERLVATGRIEEEKEDSKVYWLEIPPDEETPDAPGSPQEGT